MLRVANSCAWSRCFGRAKLRWKSHGSPGPSPRGFATDERARLFWERAETDLVEQLAAASERVFDAKLTPEAVRQRLLPSVRQSRGGDWMLKAKLPAHARFWNAGGTFADRPPSWLTAPSLWLMSGVCGLSLEVTDLRVEPPCQERPLSPQPFFAQ